jgi:RNA polymerase sigma-70 factor (ECF subfamily)
MLGISPVLCPLDALAQDVGVAAVGERAQARMSQSDTDAVVQQPTPGAASTRDAFDAALAEHQDELLQYLHRRLRDRETAADLAQETLTRMMRYRDAENVEDRKSLLFRIANNLIFEHHRVRRRHRANHHVSLDDTMHLRAPEPPVEVMVDARQAIDRLLKRTLVELPPRCRLAFMLSRFDGLSYLEIAARMDISVKMVEKHITKALVACRAAVGDRDF